MYVATSLDKYISIDVIYQYCGKIDHDAPYKDILPYKECHTTPNKDILPYHTTPYIRRNTILRLIPYTNTHRKWVRYMTSQRTVSRESCNTS